MQQEASFFEISEPQFRWAAEKQFQYHVYRVFGVGSDTVRLMHIINPIAQWKRKHISFALVC